MQILSFMHLITCINVLNNIFSLFMVYNLNMNLSLLFLLLFSIFVIYIQWNLISHIVHVIWTVIISNPP